MKSKGVTVVMILAVVALFSACNMILSLTPSVNMNCMRVVATGLLAEHMFVPKILKKPVFETIVVVAPLTLKAV